MNLIRFSCLSPGDDKYISYDNTQKLGSYWITKKLATDFINNIMHPRLIEILFTWVIRYKLGRFLKNGT